MKIIWGWYQGCNSVIWSLIFSLFTYIYSLLIEKDLCECQNISFKFICVSHLETSQFFIKRFLFLFLLFCFAYFGIFHFHVVSLLYLILTWNWLLTFKCYLLSYCGSVSMLGWAEMLCFCTGICSSVCSEAWSIISLVCFSAKISWRLEQNRAWRHLMSFWLLT